jgi:hypothetical protein
MSTAAQQIPKATASYAAKQKTALQNQAQAAYAAGDEAGYEALTQEAAKWDEGGIYRTALHTVFGGLSGGVAGAVGAATVAGNAQNLNDMQESLRQALVGADIPAAVADALARVTFQAGVLGVGSAVGGAGAGAAAMNVDANNRQLHPTERVWAQKNAAKYRDYLKSKTGETISVEDAYQRLLSAGYAMVDTAAQKTGQSDPNASQFISVNTKNDTQLFNATAAERSNPLLGGNADGSYTPEQQARFGAITPTAYINQRVTAANAVLKTDCVHDVQCASNKVSKVSAAVDALEQQKLLYQDNPILVAQINGQQSVLIGGLSSNDIRLAKVADADAAGDAQIFLLFAGTSLVKSLTAGKAMTNAPKGSTATAPSVATNTGTTGGTGAASVVASADDVGVASVAKTTGSNGSTGAAAKGDAVEVPSASTVSASAETPVGVNGGAAAKPLFGNMYPEHVIDPAKIVPTERLSGISGNFNYVITEQGNLIVGRSGHTSLTGGAPVQAAGELQLYNGNVKWIDNASGHYQPSSNIGSVAETAFNNAGLDATGKFVPKVWVPNPTLPRGGSWVKTN